jgi:hypothetical protein
MGLRFLKHSAPLEPGAGRITLGSTNVRPCWSLEQSAFAFGLVPHRPNLFSRVSV